MIYIILFFHLGGGTVFVQVLCSACCKCIHKDLVAPARNLQKSWPGIIWVSIPPQPSTELLSLPTSLLIPYNLLQKTANRIVDAKAPAEKVEVGGCPALRLQKSSKQQ